MKAKFFMALCVMMITLVACDDNTEGMGSSITPTSDGLDITTDSFKVTSCSVIANSVLARSTDGYIGRVKDPETSSYVTADFMSQFNTFENYEFPKADSIISKSNGKVIADSCELRLFINSVYGDSLNTMKLTTYEMKKPVEEGTNYYSNFDLKDKGYIRSKSNGGIEKNKSYTITDLNEDEDTRNSSSYTKNIRIMLNDSYTDTDGNEYNNYGTYLMRKYYSNTSNYKNSYNFIHNVCPGFYFETRSGLGNMTDISVTELNVYFRYISNDSIYTGLATFAGTEEVLLTTKITNDTKAISKLANDNSCTYIKSPSGIFTELTLPIKSIKLNHENDTINSAKIVLQRINNNTENEYNLDIPSTLLMVEKDSLNSFFKENKLANNKNSFLTSYTSSSSSTTTGNAYTFSNFAGIVTSMANAYKEGMAQDSEWATKHPNWNKVIIIPVTETTSTTNSSTTVTKITHNMGLSSTKLVGGNTPLKVTVVYSKFAEQ